MTSDRAAQRTYAEAERIRYWWQVERERLLSTLARVNPDLWLEPMGEGEWSCHELLAHRTFWEAWELEAYQEYVKGKPPELLEFPVEMLDTANQKAVERLRTHKPSALIGAIEDYRAESRELLKQVADRDLETAGNAVRILLGVALEHDREHRKQVEAWIAAGGDTAQRE